MAPTTPPPLSHILETALYVKDMQKAISFYRDTIGLTNQTTAIPDYLTVLQVGNTALLLFKLGKTTEDLHFDESNPEHVIPHHGPSAELLKVLQQENSSGNGEGLKQHYAFAVSTKEDVEKWEAHLKDKGVKVTGVMEWERGGRSVYFEDPDGHVGEVVCRGIWPFY